MINNKIIGCEVNENRKLRALEKWCSGEQNGTVKKNNKRYQSEFLYLKILLCKRIVAQLSLLFYSYHCSQSLHGLVLLVHIELGQVVGHGTFVLELRAQPCTT